MIRSARVPSILSRITTDKVIQTAILVTTDGELLGSTSSTFVSPVDGSKESIENIGTLLADIAIDYQRLGDDYSQLETNVSMGGGVPPPKKPSHLQCLLLEFDQGLIGVSACAGVDYLVMGIAAPDAPMGMIKTRLQLMAEHVQEALAPLTATEQQAAIYR